MPKEIRRLVFSGNEVRSALSQLTGVNKIALVAGTVVGADIVSREPLKLSCWVHLHTGQQVSKVFEEAYICASLISWCIDNRIPLARRASKSVHAMADGSIALDIVLEEETGKTASA